jgi:hypothetical protein
LYSGASHGFGIQGSTIAVTRHNPKNPVTHQPYGVPSTIIMMPMTTKRADAMPVNSLMAQRTQRIPILQACALEPVLQSLQAVCALEVSFCCGAGMASKELPQVLGQFAVDFRWLHYSTPTVA